MFFLLNLFKNLNLCTSYIKQIMNVFSFVQWNKYFHSVKDECTIQLGFASLNGTFHLSPHENICTIALINIHYLYNIHQQLVDVVKFFRRFCTRQILDLHAQCTTKSYYETRRTWDQIFVKIHLHIGLISDGFLPSCLFPSELTCI